MGEDAPARRERKGGSRKVLRSKPGGRPSRPSFRVPLCGRLPVLRCPPFALYARVQIVGGHVVVESGCASRAGCRPRAGSPLFRRRAYPSSSLRTGVGAACGADCGPPLRASPSTSGERELAALPALTCRALSHRGGGRVACGAVCAPSRVVASPSSRQGERSPGWVRGLDAESR